MMKDRTPQEPSDTQTPSPSPPLEDRGQRVEDLVDSLNKVADGLTHLTLAQEEQIKTFSSIRRIEGMLIVATVAVTFATLWLGWTTRTNAIATGAQASATQNSVDAMAETNTNIEAITTQVRDLVEATQGVETATTAGITRRPIVLRMRKEDSNSWFAVSSDGTPRGEVSALTRPRIYVEVRNPGRTHVSASVEMVVAGQSCESDSKRIQPQATATLQVRLDHRRCQIDLPIETPSIRFTVHTYDS